MNKAEICLVAINSRYYHTSFGLRYLKANLKELESNCQIVEFSLDKDPKEIAFRLIRGQHKIIGIGVYIWNRELALEIASIIKTVSPSQVLVLGGPEVSYEVESQDLFRYCDYVIMGEAELSFYQLCKSLLSDNSECGQPKLISSATPNVRELKFPYSLYSDEDIKNRYIYVEASRGCAFKCEYCLSSLDKSVRSFEVHDFLHEMKILIDRGARSFKFVDRTFNLNIEKTKQILNFFLAHMELGLFLHFEMIPDHLPVELRELITKFPAASLQFEIGIQSLNSTVNGNVSRRQNVVKMKDNFIFLRQHTGVHTHADLIVGLPDENLESFGQGFDELLRMGPDEIQVGILKRLKGTPLTEKEMKFGLKYSQRAPFEIIQTNALSFSEIQKMHRFSKYWDLYGNRGNFKNFLKEVQVLANLRHESSVFRCFLEFCEFIFNQLNRSFGIRIETQLEMAFRFLTEGHQYPLAVARAILLKDFESLNVTALPKVLRANDAVENSERNHLQLKETAIPARQVRHLRNKQALHQEVF